MSYLLQNMENELAERLKYNQLICIFIRLLLQNIFYNPPHTGVKNQL